MSTLRTSFVALAREWAAAKVPYRRVGMHRSGCNCTGFVIGLCAEMGFDRVVEECKPYLGFSRPVDHNGMLRVFETVMEKIPVVQALPGDLLLFRNIEGEPIHIAVLSEPGIIVHAPTGGAVVEHGMPPRARAFRAFRIPELGA